MKLTHIDNPNTIRKRLNEPILIENIFEVYNGIENENIKSKIYLNINNSNYMSLMDKFSSVYGYLSLLENYNVNNINTEKKIVNKCYWVNEEENIFIDFEAESTEDIVLYRKEQTLVHQFSKVSEINDVRIAAYYLIYNVKKFGADNYLKILDELSKIFDGQKFVEFEKFLIELIDKEEFNLHSKIVLYELLFPYSEELHVTLYEKIMGYIYSGKLEWRYWKSLIIMFYAFNFGKRLKLTDDVYRTTKKVNIAISEIIEKQIDFKIEKNMKMIIKKLLLS